MNKIIVIALLILFIVTTKAFAWQQVKGNIFVSNHYIEASVYNNFGAPIECQGVVYGQTQLGQSTQEHFHLSFIQPNQYAEAYLQTWGNAVFISGYAKVYCQLIQTY